MLVELSAENGLRWCHFRFMGFNMFRFFCLVFVAAATFSVSPVNRASADDQLKFVLPETGDGLPGVGPIRRYDWFKSLWQNRRADFAKKAPAQEGAVVFLGDSITQGWGRDWPQAFPN